MSITFSVREGIKSMMKARLASTLSVSSITLTILLIGIFVLAILNVRNFVGLIREKIEIEVFVDVTANDVQIEKLQEQLEQTQGIQQVEYISKAQAAERFKQEFGEDIVDVLNYNPLPPSFLISLTPDFRTPAAVNNLKNKIDGLTHVDEVVYQRPLLEKLDRYLNTILIALFILGLLIVIIASVLINNTIRLSMYARKDMIQIMRLVGATEGFIKRPFLVEGMVQGLIGAIIACIVLYYICVGIQMFLYANLSYDMPVFYALLGFGIFIGIISAFFSVQKYLRVI